MIIGAGLAGLLAAHAFPKEPIAEAAPESTEAHKALLRFRSDAVARLTGIEFKAVKVRKGIWSQGGFVAPNIALANSYSQKCLDGRIEGERSIWNLEPVTRWIAPENLYEQLIDACGNRINWGFEVNFKARTEWNDTTINTAPLPVVLKQLGIDSGLAFERAPITVQRYRVKKCDAFQTIYFPDGHTPLYRASITGDILIMEFAGGQPSDNAIYTAELFVSRAFSLPLDGMEEIGAVEQRYGKISDVDAATRKALLGKLTQEYGIYSVGRFATWRNLLLDDVVDDLSVVKRLMKSSDYERRIAAS